MADLLGRAALYAGKEAQALPFFGVERRGAVIKACVRISDEPILLRSMSYRPDVVALMHENLLPFARQEGFAEGEGGAAIIVNGRGPVEAQGEQWVVDAEGIARGQGLVFGGEAYINVPMFGAIAKVLGLPLEHVEAAIQDQWKGKAAAPNLAAAREAYAAVALAGAASVAGAGGAAGAAGAASAAGAAGAASAAGVAGAAGAGGAAGAAVARQPLSGAVEGAGGLTGTWRSQWPKLDGSKCTGCLLCWIYCPEAVIAREDRAIDYRYCKGCGVCARECPAKAIDMMKESESTREGEGEA
jgi:2-oxoacid:acceptor oxidoreductase gamma subunit (pyruvate/2-ketoisovalerate family)/2-oxoacid:acceptor oxidoreductase delta subunit (pyruvate/2-ketoisovalerate family)